MDGMRTTRIDRLATAEGAMHRCIEGTMGEVLRRNQPTMRRDGIHPNNA